MLAGGGVVYSIRVGKTPGEAKTQIAYLRHLLVHKQTLMYQPGVVY